MNTKIVQLLDLMLLNQGFISLEKACQDLEFSKRMLFYYQKMLNSHLKESGLPKLSVSDGMLCMDCRDKQAFKHVFHRSLETDYVLEAGERQDFMLLIIGLGRGGVTLDSLCEGLYISRSTALSDISVLKKYLAEEGAGLGTKVKRGYFLEGDELKLRYLLMTAYYHMETPVLREWKVRLLLKEASARSGKDQDEEVFNRLEDIILDSERETGKQFHYFSIHDTAECLLLLYLRSFHAHVSMDERMLSGYAERESAGRIAQKLETLGLYLSHEEIPYVQVLLMGAKVYTLERCQPDEEVSAFTEELLTEFERLCQIRVTANPTLLEMLLLHIRPMFYRAKYRIKTVGFLEGVMGKAGESLYNFTKIAVEACSPKYGLYVDKDEITYLSLYFSCMGNYGETDDDARDKPCILIVCGSGLGSSVYVKYQLEKILGKRFSYLISDARSMEKDVTRAVVLIVSTLDLSETDSSRQVQVIPVCAVITPAQKAELVNWLLEYAAFSREFGSLSRLVEIVEKSAKIMDQGKLVHDLQTYLNQAPEPEGEFLLSRIFLPGHTAICREKADWRKAMHIACAPLVKTGCMEPDYALDIIDVIEELGPYAECMTGVLLAHAKPSSRVHRLSLGAVLFKEPLIMEPWNKTIFLVLVLTVTDHKSHGDALVELMSNLSGPSMLKQLADCETKEKLYRLICPEG